MLVTGTAISLNVADPLASAEFLTRHVGHTVAMQADGFVSLQHPDGGPNVIFLRTGLPTFRPAHRAGSAGDGLLLVFVVDDVDAVYDTVRAAGAPAVTPPETEPWGERYCQFEDPNGIIVQFVTWV
ncbi:VOC family protein [Mycolicibacterium rufum]|uniref:VOC family protein n=1 Tax=Mycolicibacterium rufum TaxID=318424 RepID=A0A9X3BPU9_9MYCO|nr:VOC family protein [Mycolicibacterium rufum]KGI70120.1 glyoxalase [Mycolicibacterium rufum]MCV7070630.1 VOC family protein [Mycolicibacterium rufum]ULP36393.1 VOC family protein [Mycolicibacterium rufum]